MVKIRGSYEELSCPFCDRGRIEAWHIPASYSYHRVRSGKGKRTIPHKSSDIWLIKSGCNICGKSQNEVEKELRSRGII